MKLSIIVPVYNVGNYITRCLNSILEQNLDEYEVIIINDGSTDNSERKAREFCDKHENFKLYTKENGGLSSARNYGLSKAKGEYIYFLDSDDYLEKNTLGLILERLFKFSLDGIAFDYRKVDESGNAISEIKYYSDIGIVSGVKFLDRFTCVAMACLYVYRYKVLIDNDLKFFNGIYHEDELFTPQAITYCSRFQYVDICVYNYLHRKGSITTTFSNTHQKKKFDSMITVFSELMQFTNDYKKKNNLSYHPIEKKIEDLAVSLLYKTLKKDGVSSKYKRAKLKEVMPNNFRIRNGGVKKKIFWYISSFLL